MRTRRGWKHTPSLSPSQIPLEVNHQTVLFGVNSGIGAHRSAQKQLEPANFAEASPPNWISIRISRRFADCDRHSSGLYSEIKPSPPPPPPPSPRRPMQMQGRGAGRKREGRGETRFGNLCQTRGEGLDEFRICAGIRKPTSTSANERRTNPVNFCR